MQCLLQFSKYSVKKQTGYSFKIFPFPLCEIPILPPNMFIFLLYTNYIYGWFLKSLKYWVTIGEGNGNPLHYPCFENPIDGGAW